MSSRILGAFLPCKCIKLVVAVYIAETRGDVYLPKTLYSLLCGILRHMTV